MPTRYALVAALFVFAACGGSSSTAPSGTPASITLSTTTVSFSSLASTLDLIATVLDAGGSPLSGHVVTWSSNALAVATVSNAGRVTAIGNGTAQITASVGSVQSPAATVTVQQVAASLTLSPDTLRLAAVGDTATIGATVRDAGGSLMSGVAKTFATVNPAVATVVVATGRVTAVANGATTVTAQVAPGGPGLTRNVRVEVGGSLPPAYLVGGYVGTAYTDQVGPVSGGGSGYTYVVTAGALPNNLSLSSSTGQITGMPSTSGAFFFQVTASNGVLTVSERFGITISTKPASAFNLWVTYNGGVMPSANAQTAVSAALARFEQVVTGEVPNVTYPSSGLSASGPGSCQLVNASLMNGAFIDDVAILMSIGPIGGGTLARGGFCGYGRNPAPPATITGQMLLDQVAQSTASVTYLQDVIWHELAHAFGIGTLWQGSTIFAATDSVRYVGTNGKAEWTTLGGPSMGGPNDVPLEPTIAAHWNEGWFNGEIMTPVTEGPSNRLPISRMTIGALIDLGWGAVLGAADAYTLPVCQPTCTIREPAGAPGEGVLGNDAVFDRLLPLPAGAVGRH